MAQRSPLELVLLVLLLKEPLSALAQGTSQVPVAPTSEPSVGALCSTSAVGGCGRWGYCDPSVNRCVCAPGRSGADCSQTHFEACAVHPQGEMACNTFRGLMSCRCRLQCEKRYGSMSRWRVPICWDDPDLVRNTSDFPEEADGVVFRTSQWPPLGKCAKADAPRKKCELLATRTPRRAERILGGVPLPNRHCPNACSHRGTCVRPSAARAPDAEERFPLAEARASASSTVSPITPSLFSNSADVNALQPRCICHEGYSGAACERTDASLCFNRCSGHGDCVGRFCLCDRNYHGVDCSLSALSRAAPRHAAAWRTTTAAPTSSAGLGAQSALSKLLFNPADASQGSSARSSSPLSSQQLAAELLAPRSAKHVPIWSYPLPTDWSLEHVYQRDQKRRGQYYANLMFLEQLHAHGHAVATPDEAALFFVPVMVMQMAGNLWHPIDFLKETVRYVSTTYPYWNRSAGRDHVFFLTTDRGGCWKPWELQHSIIITYLGFPASEAYFGFEERLEWPPKGPQRRNNAYDTRVGSIATELACYDGRKDVVVPVDANIGAKEEAKLPAPGSFWKCRSQYKALLFMGGSMQNMGRVEYSQGVRQAIAKYHSNESEFVLGGEFTLDDLRASRFCLAPSGWGWGWRLSLTMVTQCVPVIIQPNVTQPFEEFLPYDTFSLRLRKADVPNLPAILRAVPDYKLCSMQRELARFYRAILWQRPFGSAYSNAYDLTMVALCRRAKRLAAIFDASKAHQTSYLAQHTLDCADSLEKAGIVF